MSFFALIILTLYPHRQPLWGVSDWVEHNLNRTPHTHIRTYTYAQDTHIINHTPANIYMHTEKKQNNMQHIEQNIQENTETEHTIQNTQNNAQPQHRCSTDYLHTYSFDLYHEYVAIKNSNTIELYTISKD